MQAFLLIEMFKDAKQILMYCDICGRFATSFGHKPLRPIETIYYFELDYKYWSVVHQEQEEGILYLAIDHFAR